MFVFFSHHECVFALIGLWSRNEGVLYIGALQLHSEVRISELRVGIVIWSTPWSHISNSGSWMNPTGQEFKMAASCANRTHFISLITVSHSGQPSLVLIPEHFSTLCVKTVVIKKLCQLTMASCG